MEKEAVEQEKQEHMPQEEIRRKVPHRLCGALDLHRKEHLGGVRTVGDEHQASLRT